MKQLLGPITWLCLATSAGAQLSQQLQGILQQYQKTLNIIGVSASVWAPQLGVWNSTAGWIDTVNGTPVDTNTLFGIGSITKTLTAVAPTAPPTQNIELHPVRVAYASSTITPSSQDLLTVRSIGEN